MDWRYACSVMEGGWKGGKEGGGGKEERGEQGDGLGGYGCCIEVRS